MTRARALRQASTDAERALWRVLRGRQFAGSKFRRQHPCGPYVLDFYCRARGLVVEVDGSQHLTPTGTMRDVARTAFLTALGLRVLRFTNVEVLTQPWAVAEAIASTLATPHPRPLPRGEGAVLAPHPSPLPWGEGVADVP